MDAQKAVEKVLGRELIPLEAGGAEAERWFDDIDTGLRTPKQVAALLVRWIRQETAYVPSLPIGGEVPHEALVTTDDPAMRARADALGAYYFRKAEDGDDALSFRSWYLRDGLIGPSRVGAWIAAQDRAVEELIARQDEAGTYGGRTLGTVHFLLRGRVCRRVVIASVEGDAGARVLGQLIELASVLSRRYRWSEAGATMYVLTGARPTVRIGAATLETRHGANGASTRVTLTVDPMTSPAEVERWYRQLRSLIAPGARIRGQSEKWYRLAAFYADMPADEATAAARLRWNDTFPAWKYADDTNFRNHARTAYRRMAQEQWREPGTPVSNPAGPSR